MREREALENVSMGRLGSTIQVHVNAAKSFLGTEPITDDMHQMLEDMRRFGELKVDVNRRVVKEIYRSVAAQINREMERRMKDALYGLSSAYSDATLAAAATSLALRNTTVRARKRETKR